MDSIKPFVLTFDSDLRRVGGFFPGTLVFSTNKTDATDNTIQ